ncbi:MAG: polysaccharide deacetylase family protein [Lachnospiraceae bacterium]|nr:polysaccharide deacetylase family protein [Lachnospiraceae bacterium]
MAQHDDIEERRRRRMRREERRRRQRRQALIARAVVLVVLVAVLVGIIALASRLTKKDNTEGTEGGAAVNASGADGSGYAASADGANSEAASSGEASSAGSAQTVSTVAAKADLSTKEGVLDYARYLTAQYDYDGAVAAIQSFAGYESDGDLTAEINTITMAKNACTPVEVSTTPHVFYHSLINDSRGLIASATCTEERVEKNNKAMTTVGEFDAMINDMYNAGYVLISLDDLITKTENADGTVTISKNTNLYLPEGKKPLIMSEDDLSYYHSYGENGAQGYADRLVIDENGEVKCLFTDVDGQTKIGDYDMVPRIDTFIKEHPDFSYHGAKPTVALTGYNGIFGYRTNDYYKEGPEGADLNEAQKQFLRNHPEYDYDTDVAEATKIAEAMKANGWTFASHTYGHRNATDATPEQLQTDHERWKIAVGKCIGETNKIIFAFGADIGPVMGYTADNQKFTYFKSQGFDIFCNVDGNIGWTEFGTNYVRTGRVALDGVSMYNAITPGTPSHDTYAHDFEVLGIYDVASFFDPNRNPAYCLSES